MAQEGEEDPRWKDRIQELRRSGQQAQAEILQAYVGVRGLRQTLNAQCQELLQQRAVLERGGPQDEHAGNAFDMHSEYPSLKIVRALGKATYGHPGLDRVWRRYATVFGLSGWGEVTNSHVIRFLTWVTMWLDERINFREMDDGDGEGGGGECLVLNAENVAAAATEWINASGGEGGEGTKRRRRGRRGRRKGETPTRKFQRDMETRGREKMERGALLGWGGDALVEGGLLSRVQAKHYVTTSKGERQMGGWGTTRELYNTNKCFNGVLTCTATKYFGKDGQGGGGGWHDYQVDHHEALQEAMYTHDASMHEPHPYRLILILTSPQPTCTYSLPTPSPHTPSYCVAKGLRTKGKGKKREPGAGGQVAVWCIQNAAAAEQWPVDGGLVIAQLGPTLCAQGIQLTATTGRPHKNTNDDQQTTCATCTHRQARTPENERGNGDLTGDGRCEDSRHAFWRVWREEEEKRKRILNGEGGGEGKTKLDALTESYDTCNRILKYAPQKHLRRLWALTQEGTRDTVGEVGTWVYCAYSPWDGRIYWGQTGGRGEPTRVIDRFYREVSDAKAWSKLYGSKGKMGPTFLRVMSEVGPHRFCVVPVRAPRPWAATATERYFILNYPRNLNDRKPARRSYMRWLVRSRLHTALTDKGLNDSTAWKSYINAKRLTLHPRDALAILTRARTALPATDYGKLQTRLLAHIRVKTGMRLPRVCTFHVPFADKGVRAAVRKEFKAFLREVKYPRPLKRYLEGAIHVPLTVPTRVLNLWCTDRITLAPKAMRAVIQGPDPCACSTTKYGAREGREVGDREGLGGECAHVCLHEPARMEEVFGSHHRAVAHAQNNMSARPSLRRVREGIAVSMDGVRNTLPKVAPFCFARLQKAIYVIAETQLRATVKNEGRGEGGGRRGKGGEGGGRGSDGDRDKTVSPRTPGMVPCPLGQERPQKRHRMHPHVLRPSTRSTGERQLRPLPRGDERAKCNDDLPHILLFHVANYPSTSGPYEPSGCKDVLV